MNLTDLEIGVSMVTKFFIVGLPESGKTTFLGALAFTLTNSLSGKNKYEIDKINEFEYMNGLADVWSSCENIGRTNNGIYEKTTLYLKNQCGDAIELIIPDQSGEEFERVISSREMTQVMYDDIINCDKILVFINPNTMSKDMMINDISEEFRDGKNKNNEITNKNNVHEQVKYVMLLQDIAKVRKSATDIKIIISAWDAYAYEGCPRDLLKSKVPLVWQYLSANEGSYNCEYWGISAQGGNLDEENVKSKLLDYDNPVERIIVVEQNNREKSHDLTMLLE